MPRLRLFILWIVCVCLPLQGWAAAAMASCGPGHAGRGATVAMEARAAMGRTPDVAIVAIERPTHAAQVAHGPAQGHVQEQAGARMRHGHGDHVVSESLAVPAGLHDPALATIAPSTLLADHPAQDHGAHPCHDGIAHAGTPADADPVASADTPHACGTCAVCHATALTGRLDVAVLHDLPPADLAEPALVAATRVPRVLDRPPRA